MPEITSILLGADANLHAYYRFESDGTDSGPNGYTLTGSGTPTHATGRFGNGVDLEASSSQYYTRAAAANANVTTSQTWTAWIKVESTGITGIIAGFDKGSDRGRKFYIHTDNKIYNFFSGLSANASSSGTLSAGEWYFVAMRYSSSDGTSAVWINDTKTEVSSVTGTPDATAAALGVGADFTGGSDAATNFFDGMIDDLTIFDRALTDAEISSIYSGFIPRITFID